MGNSALSAVTNSRRVAVGASSRTRAADEDDAGGESVRIHSSHAVSMLCSHRPSTGDSEASANHRIEKCLPAGAGSSFGAVALRLLESVVDGDRKSRMRLFGEALHRLRHALEEESLSLLALPP